MLPNHVLVVWRDRDRWGVWGESVTGEYYPAPAFTGTAKEVAAWLRQHAYMGVWSLHDAGVVGEYVRKEGVTA